MRGNGHRVVILGGGFGGLYAAKSLAASPAEVVAKEREALDEARRKLSAVEAAMAELERSRK